MILGFVFISFLGVSEAGGTIAFLTRNYRNLQLFRGPCFEKTTRSRRSLRQKLVISLDSHLPNKGRNMFTVRWEYDVYCRPRLHYPTRSFLTPCYTNNGIHDAGIEDNFISILTVKTVQQRSNALHTVFTSQKM